MSARNRTLGVALATVVGLTAAASDGRAQSPAPDDGQFERFSTATWIHLLGDARLRPRAEFALWERRATVAAELGAALRDGWYDVDEAQRHLARLSALQLLHEFESTAAPALDAVLACAVSPEWSNEASAVQAALQQIALASGPSGFAKVVDQRERFPRLAVPSYLHLDDLRERFYFDTRCAIDELVDVVESGREPHAGIAVEVLAQRWAEVADAHRRQRRRVTRVLEDRLRELGVDLGAPRRVRPFRRSNGRTGLALARIAPTTHGSILGHVTRTRRIDPVERIEGLRALAVFRGLAPFALAAVVERLHDPDPRVARQAIATLGGLGSHARACLGALEPLLGADDDQLARRAIAALQSIEAGRGDRGRRHRVVWWWPDGTRQAEGLLDGGVPNGTWTFYHRNGAVRSTGEYADGLESGPWSLFHANGMTAARGSFTAGRPSGRWVGLHDDGEPAWERDFTRSRGRDARRSRER